MFTEQTSKILDTLSAIDTRLAKLESATLHSDDRRSGGRGLRSRHEDPDDEADADDESNPVEQRSRRKSKMSDILHLPRNREAVKWLNVSVTSSV